MVTLVHQTYHDVLVGKKGKVSGRGARENDKGATSL